MQAPHCFLGDGRDSQTARFSLAYLPLSRSPRSGKVSGVALRQCECLVSGHGAKVWRRLTAADAAAVCVCVCAGDDVFVVSGRLCG